MPISVQITLIICLTILAITFITNKNEKKGDK